MQVRKVCQSVTRLLALLTKWTTWIGAGVTVLGYVSKALKWGNTIGLFSFIEKNLQVIWLVAVTAGMFTLWIWTSRLHRRFVRGFSDNFGEDLQANWDFDGGWRIVDREFLKGTLLVTGSDEQPEAAGITKIGAQWENYTFTFRALIRNECLGVIVRAQDLSNYYMFQIRTDKVRPHRRVTVPVIERRATSQSEEQAHVEPIRFVTGWDIPGHLQTSITPELESWFDVKVIVRGQSVSLYVNDDLVSHQDSYLHIPTGKVGFRNCGSELALVRNVRVTLHN